MRRLEADSAGLPPVWVGLAWVYSSAFWLWLVANAIAGDRWALATPAALRMLATMAVGIGLCAGERAAWAPAAFISALYAVLAAAGAVAGGVVVATLPPGWLSWRPVPVFGWTASDTLGVSLLLSGGTAVSVCTLYALWRRRNAFEVPVRRAFKTIVADGLIPGLAVFLLDAWVIGTLLSYSRSG